MSEPLSGSMEENRRALLVFYRGRSVEYAALAVILAIVLIAEVTLLGWTTFPQFLVYPLLLATAAPTLFLIYSAVFWWRMVGYVVSTPAPSARGDSMVALHEGYIHRARESTPAFILPGGRKLDGLVIAITTLILFLVSLPLSYYVTGLHAGLLFGLLVTLGFLGAIVIVVVLLYLVVLSQRASASLQIARRLATLNQYGDEFRLAASASPQGREEVVQPSVVVLMRDLTNRVVAEIKNIGALMVWITPEQKKALAEAVASISTGMMALNLKIEAEKVTQAYRKVVSS